MATATLSQKVQDAVENIRETLDEFDPEELLSVAEETAREFRSKVPVENLTGRAIDCIKAYPLQAVGVAFVGGLLMTAILGWLTAPAAQTGDSLVS